MRLKLGWFKGPLDFQFVTTVGEFRLLSGFFFLSRLKDQLTAPLQTFPFVQRERNLTEISLALVPDTVEKDTVGAV